MEIRSGVSDGNNSAEAMSDSELVRLEATDYNSKYLLHLKKVLGTLILRSHPFQILGTFDKRDVEWK